MSRTRSFLFHTRKVVGHILCKNYNIQIQLPACTEGIDIVLFDWNTLGQSSVSDTEYTRKTLSLQTLLADNAFYALQENSQSFYVYSGICEFSVLSP